MKHSYTTSLTADNTEFRKTCTVIEGNVKGIKKGTLLVDVDGTMIQTYNASGKEIKVFNDYDVDAVYVDSEIDLTGIVNNKLK